LTEDLSGLLGFDALARRTHGFLSQAGSSHISALDTIISTTKPPPACNTRPMTKTAAQAAKRRRPIAEACAQLPGTTASKSINKIANR
jgi:hypothetical protein